MHHLRENVRISPFTTIKVGGPARYFFEAHSDEELEHAVAFAADHDHPIFILGGGSNVLFPDEGFSGLVIKMSTRKTRYEDVDESSVRVIADAGVSWDHLVVQTTDKGLWGIENLAAIPGTVGGAVVQNIGAYGAELENAVEWVEVLDVTTRKRSQIKKEACAFAYRESLWKKKEGRSHVVLRAAFLLKKVSAPNIGYKDIPKYFAEHKLTPKTPADIRDAVRAIRATKLPPLNNVGTAGSFFKNPTAERAVVDELLHKYPEMPFFIEPDGRCKLSAAWLIDHAAGFKGKREGDVGSWGKQALVLVNYGNAKAKEIKKFAREIADAVHHATGIMLEAEVVIVENKKS